MTSFKVVVIEDEELVRNAIILTTPWDKYCCEVIGEANNGIDGESLIRRLNPDIVITDIRMPGQDGITMLEKTTPEYVLILSGYSEFEYAKKALKLGVCDYILKPIDDQEFLKAIATITKKISNSSAQNKNKTLPSENVLFRPITEQSKNDKQSYYVFQATSFIRSNYNLLGLSLRLVAEKIGINESYLSRLFKIKTGYTFLEYLQRYRIKKALELMKDQRLRINEIARETGFSDMSYFSCVFRKFIGMSPSSFINGKKNSGDKIS